MMITAQHAACRCLLRIQIRSLKTQNTFPSLGEEIQTELMMNKVHGQVRRKLNPRLRKKPSTSAPFGLTREEMTMLRLKQQDKGILSGWLRRRKQLGRDSPASFEPGITAGLSGNEVDLWDATVAGFSSHQWRGFDLKDQLHAENCAFLVVRSCLHGDYCL
mmetsp:Transcript_9931/g.41980  ORF Transcript_9931/g.41980 Transcript_9931/m.41980 type:complete len:161 (-) Transcript_9931:703-1185(-)